MILYFLADIGIVSKRNKMTFCIYSFAAYISLRCSFSCQKLIELKVFEVVLGDLKCQKSVEPSTCGFCAGDDVLLWDECIGAIILI